jgi:hypothetical protein
MTKAEVMEAIASLEDFISRLDTWVLIFAGLVAVGVVGEAVLGVWHWKLDGRMRDLRHTESQIHETELGQLTKDTAAANARAKEAELALEQFKAPRTISPEQQSKLVSELKLFAGTEFDASTSVENTEQLRLLVSLTEILSKAGWKQIDWKYAVPGIPTYKAGNPTSPDIGSAATDNIDVQVHRESIERLKPAADALARVLNAIGIKANAPVIDRNTQNTGNVQALHLIVGHKQ